MKPKKAQALPRPRSVQTTKPATDRKLPPTTTTTPGGRKVEEENREALARFETGRNVSSDVPRFYTKTAPDMPSNFSVAETVRKDAPPEPVSSEETFLRGIIRSLNNETLELRNELRVKGKK